MRLAYEKADDQLQSVYADAVSLTRKFCTEDK